MTCYTALITPFDPSGSLDEPGLVALIKRQLDANVSGLVVLGTTGEAPTLSTEEKERVISVARATVSDVPLMVGCGVYGTEQTLANIKKAAKLGADSALVISPYYNKPTQDGLYRHFAFLAHASPLPILVYNHVGRCGVNIEPETLYRISHLPNILGVKDATTNMDQISAIIQKIKWEHPEFLLLSGNDALTLPTMALGGDGIVSVVGNLIPEKMVALTQACAQGDFEAARALHYELLPLFHASNFEINPIPIKAALQMAGFPAGSPRLPLTPLSETYIPQLDACLEKFLSPC